MLASQRSGHAPACFLSIKILLVVALSLVLSARIEAQQTSGAFFSPSSSESAVTGPKIWLSGVEPVPIVVRNTDKLSEEVVGGEAQPLSMATADVDGDGYADLVTGFTTPTGGAILIHRGNRDAFAPQSSATVDAIGHGQFPPPFLPNVQSMNIPVHPNFLALGRFTSSGHDDLLIAARGGSNLYVFPGNGKGRFGSPQVIRVSGTVTSLASQRLLRSVHFDNVVVGVATPEGGSLLVFTGSMHGLGSPAEFQLPAPPTSITFGDFGDSYSDTAFVAGGKVFILHSSTFHVEQISLPLNATSLALGSFAFDRNSSLQMALLSSDGTIYIAAHSEFDPRPLTIEEHQAHLRAGRRGFANSSNGVRSVPQNGWQIVESIAGAAAFSSGQLPIFFRTRISDHAADDIMVLNPSLGQLAVISHPNVTPGASSFKPAQISTRPYDGSVVAAMPMRTNIDNRPGIVALHQGQLAPAVMMPLPDPTFFVNRTDDPTPGTTAATCNNTSNADTSSSCSLREAVLKANATAGTDTIILAAGTYTLSIARVDGDNTGAHGGLYINDSVNIVGAGQASTIIQGGTSAATGVDLVFAVNEDIQTITNASASFSNLTIKFGHNRGSVAGFDGDGGCMEYDTGSSGAANLSLTNVTISNCVTQDGNGGGIAIFNASVPGGGTGLATISNSIFQNNSVAEAGAGSAGSGGGIWVADLARMTLSNSQVTSNTATQVNGGGRGVGGGIFIFSAGSGSRQTQIHGTAITNNNASGFGGGIWSSSNLLIDNTGGPTTISGNAAGANGGGSQNGGGIYLNTAAPDSTTLTKITITGNTATGSGGGIASGNASGAGSLTMHFSRLAGNTASTGSNLANNDTSITATNNWWGTNAPANTIVTTVGTTTFDPFVVLANTVSPSTIRINQSTTVTGSLAQDNHGSTTALAGNLDVLAGLPIIFGNATFGSVPQAQPETLSASAQATATFTAGGTGGLGHIDAVVDQQTVTANITILEPLQITKTFNPTTVPLNTSSVLTFAVSNPNVIAVDASFTDTLPAGLVVAATPGVTNTCGGTVTATAGAGSISFSNASLPVGACSITVKVSSASDGSYNNTVTINSTAASTGATSTSSAILTVINPPSITKAFGAASIPLNGSTSLTFTITDSNVNSALNGLAFTDTLPAGLVVSTPSGLNNTCGGTATAAAGSSSVSLTGGTLAAGASCTVTVNVQGTTGGVKNNSVTVSSTNGGTGNTSNASITVVGPPVITKAFGAASIPLNGSTSLTFTIQNGNATALTGVAFTDALPSGLVVSTPNGLSGSCGSGTITATPGTNTIALTGGTIAANSSCSFSLNVTGTVTGLQNNTTSAVTSTEGGTGNTATASIKVEAPATISTLFNPTSIALHATTSLTFTITNPAANVDALTGVAFTDALPTGLTVASASASLCGGTLTTTAPTGITLTGATIAANSQCQFSVTVTGASSGQFTNTTGSVSSTNGGTGNTSAASLTVASAPVITKAFAATKIPVNGTTSLTFSVQNPNTNVSLDGIAFTDSLPAGMVVSSTPNLTNTCGGTVTAIAGSSSVTMSGGTEAGSASCALSVDIQGSTVGVKNNSVTVTSTEGGTGNTSNASITVVGPPLIAKTFGAASIPLNGSTSLTFTLQNANNGTSITGVAFTDTMPAGLVIASPNGLTGSCGSGTITATPGTNVISLSSGTIAASSSCTFAVNVTGIGAGLENNTTGNVTSTEGGTGTSATASVKVEAPPSISKAFSPTSIALHATTSLTFTITNPAANVDAQAGVAFTDTLPTGLTVASASATVCGGTLTTTAPTGIALAGATIAANSQCQFSVTITGNSSGQFTNTTGNVSSTNGGTGNTASANLTVANAPALTTAFGAANIPLNGATSLTFTVQNPNSNLTLTGISFTDSLPAGLVVASTPNLSNTCGGVATALAGSSSVSLSGVTETASTTCAISVSVQGVTAGVKNNSVTVTSTEGGTGNTSNASLTVVSAGTITESFGALSMPLNGSTALGFTIQNNNNTQSLTGLGFSDTLPAGLVISTPNGGTGNCGGGLITAAPGTKLISLSNATLSAGASCTFSVNVTGTAAGAQTNGTGNLTSNEGGNGGSTSANIAVEAPPVIAKAFGAANLPPNQSTSLTFTVTNPAANSLPLNGVAFIDTFPTGLVVATPSGLSGSCGGGTITATSGSGSVALAGATIAAGSSCTFAVNVTATVAGSFLNTTGAVTSTNGGTGNTASANLKSAAAPTLGASFSAPTVPLNGSTTLTFTLTNPGANASPLTGIAFSDILPAGLEVATPNGATQSCSSGTLIANPASSSVSFSGGTLAANTVCKISVNVSGISVGVQNNTSGPISSTESGPGNVSNTASITVVAPPSISAAFGAPSISLGGSTTLSFTLSNPNAAAVNLSNVGFSNSLPAGLLIDSPSGLTGTCGGTLNGAPGTASVVLSGGNIAAGSSCTINVSVKAAAAGTKLDATGPVTSDNGGAGNSATASLDVLAADLAISTSHIGSLTQSQTGETYTITVTNLGNGSTTGTVTVNDVLPTGLTATSISGTGWTCTVSPLSCSRSDILAGGASYPAIDLVVTVANDAPATVVDSTMVTGGGDSNSSNNRATDTASVSGFSLADSPSTETISSGQTASYSFVITPQGAPLNSTVTLAVSGLPTNAAANILPATFTLGASPETATLTITTATGDQFISKSSFLRPHVLATLVPMLGFVIVSGVGAGNRRRRRRLALWLALPVVLLITILPGCGAAKNGFKTIGSPAGTYVLTLTATSGGIQQSKTVTLVVK